MNFKSNFFPSLCALVFVASVCLVADVSGSNCDAWDVKCPGCVSQPNATDFLTLIADLCLGNCMYPSDAPSCTYSVSQMNPAMQKMCPSSLFTLFVLLVLSFKFLLSIIISLKLSLLAWPVLVAFVKLALILGISKDVLVKLDIAGVLTASLFAFLGIS